MAHRVLALETCRRWSAATNLKRRGSTYYCRRRIPHDLIQHYDGRTELAISLHTTSLPEARRRGSAQWLQWKAEFEALRRRRHNGAPYPLAELTDDQVQAIAEERYVNVLLVDQIDRDGGLTHEQYDAKADGITEGEEIYREALAMGDIEPVRHLIDLGLKSCGITLPAGSPSYRALGVALLRAVVRANGSLHERQQGIIVDTPRPHAVPLATPHGNRKDDGVSLADLLEKWAAERKPTPRARQEWGLVVRRFAALHGELPLGMIEKRHVVAYKDKLLKDDAATATINKHLGALASLLQLAADNDLCAVNVARGVKVRGSKVPEESRLPYDIEDLQKIFSSPVFTAGLRPIGGAGEAAYLASAPGPVDRCALRGTRAGHGGRREGVRRRCALLEHQRPR